MEFARGSDDPEEKIPVPLPPPTDSVLSLASGSIDCRRLWIGNLDMRLTEYSLLKIVETYGELEKFDFMYHLGPGPERGKPRGYCFVTYSTSHGADRALRFLDGKIVLSRKLVVRRANATHPMSSFAFMEPRRSSTAAPVDEKTAATLRRKRISDIEQQLHRMSASDSGADFGKSNHWSATQSSLRAQARPYEMRRRP